LSVNACSLLSGTLSDVKARPHQQHCRSKNVECYKSNISFDKVECFDIVAVDNNVGRVFREISSFQQSRNKLNMFNMFRLCRKDEISFDFVERIVRLVAFDIVASTGVDGALDCMRELVMLLPFDRCTCRHTQWHQRDDEYRCLQRVDTRQRPPHHRHRPQGARPRHIPLPPALMVDLSKHWLDV